MTSAICQVRSASLGGVWTNTTSGAISVAANETIEVRLLDSAGVGAWYIDVSGRDDLVSAPTITQAVNPLGYATFTSPLSPASGWAIIIRSRVGNNSLTRDANGLVRPEYTSTFKLCLLTLSGLQLVAGTEERYEGNAVAGWAAPVNELLRTNGGYPTGDASSLRGVLVSVTAPSPGQVLHCPSAGTWEPHTLIPADLGIAIGTSAGTYCAGDDPRLSASGGVPDAHAPSHKHGGTDALATSTPAANAIPESYGNGKLAIGWFPTGSTSGDLCLGNDPRLSVSGSGGVAGYALTSSEFIVPAEASGSIVTLSSTPVWLTAGRVVALEGAGAICNVGMFDVEGVTGTSISLVNNDRTNNAASGTVVAAGKLVELDDLDTFTSTDIFTYGDLNVIGGQITLGWGGLVGANDIHSSSGSGITLFADNTTVALRNGSPTTSTGGVELGSYNNTGPRLLWGSGAPSASVPDSSMYFRAGTGVSFRENGVWTKRLKTALLTDANESVNVSTANRYILQATTYTANHSVTAGTTGASNLNSYMEFEIHNSTAYTFTLINGGPGAGTLVVVPANTQCLVPCAWNGTNWYTDGGVPIE